jgi:hypothetical protein
MDRTRSQVQGDKLYVVELFEGVRKMLSTVKGIRSDRLISLYDKSYEEASKQIFFSLTLSRRVSLSVP